MRTVRWLALKTQAARSSPLLTNTSHYLNTEMAAG
uniref:Uncharacterized protein n=1 Tax=Anguilla anguilla TaxID=7936 RepID=A0A0E9Y1V7_ANGAN